MRTSLPTLFVAAFAGWTTLAPIDAAPELELRKGDRICYIGNTLADRMQHHGWLETLVQTRFPEREIVVRNLGFSADELDVRPRSANFGSPDQHLSHSEADLIFAFFGYNESFAGEEGLSGFRTRLAEFLTKIAEQKYNGESAPRVVLFSPIAHEDLHSPHLPDGSENNRRLALYTSAMAAVAKEHDVRFVDLFSATANLYARAPKPLTINGIHLTEEGNRRLAEIIDGELFGEAPARDEASLARVREAVLEKNLYWHNRYRATDGYSVFGGRSSLKFVDGQTNFVVMQRELEMLDVMTANRDRRVWAVARGGKFKVDDSNAPPPLEVKTNRPGKTRGGEHDFLTGTGAIAKMTIAKGMSVGLFASEEQFPELVNPVQCSVDPKGRLWVAAWPTYPHWNPRKPLNDKLVILPDEDRDGRADRCIVFADGLHNPTGFEFWGGGVIVAQAPDLVFLRDTDGDDKADERIRLLHGIDSADTHHTANSFVIGPGGWLYFQRGVFHVMGIETPWGAPYRSSQTAMYRFNPRTYEFQFHFPIGPNPHGDVFDEWGYQFATDGTSGNGFYVGFPGRGAPRHLFQKRVRPVPAIGLLASPHFPEKNQGNLLICNTIGFQGVAQYKFVDDGAGIRAEEVETIVVSSDPNFRPSDVEVGSDGALYILDWHNPLIGHMQHNLRDPSRDHDHGRVYRVTADGRPLVEPADLTGPTADVVKHLDAPMLSRRYRARLELSGRNSEEVAAAVKAWSAKFDEKNANHARALVESLWVHQQHRIVNVELLRRVLRSPEPHARAAAVRVLRDWADEVPDTGALLLELAADRHPRVRAEAVVASVFYRGPDAAEIVFEAERLPTDVQLDFVLREARRSIDVDAYVKHVLDSGKKLSEAAYAYVLRNASVADLLKLERTESVFRAILSRSDVEVTHLREAIQGLARIENAAELQVLLNVVEDLDARERDASFAGLAQILGESMAGDVQSARAQVRRLATDGKRAETRRMGYAAWIAADGSAESALQLASKDKVRLRELLEAIALIDAKQVPEGLYDEVRPLLFDLPEHLRETGEGAELDENGVLVEYFFPRPRDATIESFAKHEPKAAGIVPEIKFDVPQIQQRDGFGLRFTGMLRVERAGRYRFFTNSDDGSRLYVANELVVNNDGNHGMVERRGQIRLQPGEHPIVVTYYDNGGNDGLIVSWAGPGFRKQRIPSERLSSPRRDTIHDVAVRSLSSIPGREAEKFRDLARLVADGKQVVSSVRALSELPEDSWVESEIGALAVNLASYVSEIPERYRTSRSALDVMRLGDTLAAKLSPERAREVQARLADLKVQMIRIGTVPERMIYDKERLAVAAGRRVEFIISNTDNMPHNFAVTIPGALEEVGLLAEETAQDEDAEARQYIPKSEKIILASRLLQPGETQALGFDVPNDPGIYPYVCTYPGHWRRMYGALYVVRDLKAYLADPEAYLAANPLPLKDELLKYTARNTEWTIADLTPEVAALHGGRSYEVGRSLFRAASCSACHRLGDEGQNVGPDLAQLDEQKRTTEHILKSLIEPSAEIEERYFSYTFVLESGDVVTGMVIEETADAVKLATDPLGKAPPTVLAPDAIASREKADTSIMPKGLLSKLTREEILDLIAYVHARGDAKHKIFEKHDH